MKAKPGTVDQYLAYFPDETREILETVRARIKKLAPKVEEEISYGIPCFKMNGTFLIYFAGYKKHISLYPAPTSDPAFAKEFANYKTSKGTIQFQLNEPVPYGLITKIIRAMVAKNKARTKQRNAAKKITKKVTKK
jgi:uncharacterized protein YdhG (YjbR/CyaY superfamily)